MGFATGWAGGPSSSNSQLGYGYGQTYTDFTSNRAMATTYYNTTTRPITISVWGTASTTSMYLQGNVNGVVVATSTQIYVNPAVGGIYFVVPPGASYSVTVPTGTLTVTKWFEWR